MDFISFYINNIILLENNVVDLTNNETAAFYKNIKF